MAATVTGTGPAEMKLLAAKLREADPALKRELRRNLKALAAPSVARARASILAMPSRHDGALRGHVARTVSASAGFTRSGARLDIISSGRKMPAGMDNLPAYLDSAKGWNHPVFGRQMPEKTALAARRILGKGKGRGHGRGWTWTRQEGKPGWFEIPLARGAPEFRAAAQQAIDETSRKLS